MSQQAKGLAWLLAAGLLAFGLAAGLPFFAARVPWSVERAMGRALGEGVSAQVCSEGPPAATASLRKLVARLYPLDAADAAMPISVEVVSGETINAFASLGGRIYVYDGLLQQAESPEELAGVLAHEMEHVRRRHIIQGFAVRLLTAGALRAVFSGQASSLGGLFLNLSFSRQEEREADEGGLARLSRARIDASGFAHFFERMEKKGSLPAILSDHPADAGRAALARRYEGRPSTPVLSAEEWSALRSICR